ncbi:MAG TPA: SRPBCC family protein [Pyrinomonadaceae bacterium]|nr:SRPBCC family protein [Pyrinomonadaceae bacterium]
MNRELRLLSGAGLGAALMYFLDPERGRRRRALLRDKLISAKRKAPRALEVTARDLRNRAQGLVAEAAAKVTCDQPPDEKLVARVRSELGKVVSHPGAIEVSADRGRVQLTGHVLADELDDLLAAVSAVPGVREIDNQLQVHQSPDHVPALQGGKPRRKNALAFMKQNWPPAVRVLAAAVGVALIIQNLKRRTVTSRILGTVGLSLVARSAINKDMKRLVGFAPDAIDIQKSINIDAPVERVFAFWTNYENFPRFMSNVVEVKDLGDGRSHWVVMGPTGKSVEWDAVVTEFEPNRVLAWKTVAGSEVESHGSVRFETNPDGSTRVDVKLHYTPPAGVLGHVVAKLFGRDPETEMEEDLMRMKSYIETGVEPHDAASTESSQARAATAT